MVPLIKGDYMIAAIYVFVTVFIILFMAGKINQLRKYWYESKDQLTRRYLDIGKLNEEISVLTNRISILKEDYNCVCEDLDETELHRQELADEFESLQLDYNTILDEKNSSVAFALRMQDDRDNYLNKLVKLQKKYKAKK
jgi:hypothetical protein